MLRLPALPAAVTARHFEWPARRNHAPPGRPAGSIRIYTFCGTSLSSRRSSVRARAISGTDQMR